MFEGRNRFVGGLIIPYTRKREVLTPSMHEHDAALPLLILKHSPHSERRRVILLLFGESTVERGDDVAEHRELAVRRIPRLPPITLKDPPFVGHGHLL